MCDGPETSASMEVISEEKQEAPSESHFLMSVKVNENKSVHAHDASASRQPSAGVMRTDTHGWRMASHGSWESPFERDATLPDPSSRAWD